MFMRKLLVMFIMVLCSLLVACGGNEFAGDTNKSEEAEENESVEEVEEEEEATGEPQLEIVQSTGGAWKNSIDTVWVHSSAIFENTGEVPVRIGEAQMNFEGTDESILGTSPMVFSVPSIVEPGEQAYISESTVLDGVDDPDAYEETTYNFGFDQTDEDPVLLETSNVKGTKGDEFSPYQVTGVVTNTTDDMQDDIRIAAALFSTDDELLGVLTGSVDVGLNPDSDAGFELSYPEIPGDVADDIENVEVKAYGFNW